MKSKQKLMTLALSALALGSVQSQAVSFDFSTATGTGLIAFDGAGNFSFGSPAFEIDTGSAIDLLGDISGTFAIGAIGGGYATVTGAGSITIDDGATDLTADLDLVDIAVIGTGGNINVFGALNLSNISYAGANADLVALFNDGSGALVITFQFVPGVPLTALKSGVHETSFSGSIFSRSSIVPDGGASAILLGAGLLGLAAFNRRQS